MERRFEDQQKFTKEVLERKGSSFPLTYSDKVKWTKDYILYILSECNDLLGQLDWKTHWSNNAPLIESNIGIEIIDIQKYVWGLSKIWDIDKDKFVEFYDMKSAAVRSKWEQENLLGLLANQDKVCIIDIDGVLTPYPLCFTSWVKNTYGVEVHQSDAIEWGKYKVLYRESGAKRTLPIIETSREALKLLKAKGYTIVLLTNRPSDIYQRIYSDTIFWLKESGYEYDYIFWAKEKKIIEIINKCKDIKFVVDDYLPVCQEFESAGIKSYLYGNNGKFHRKINSLMEIDELQ